MLFNFNGRTLKSWKMCSLFDKECWQILFEIKLVTVGRSQVYDSYTVTSNWTWLFWHRISSTKYKYGNFSSHWKPIDIRFWQFVKHQNLATPEYMHTCACIYNTEYFCLFNVVHLMCLKTFQNFNTHVSIWMVGLHWKLHSKLFHATENEFRMYESAAFQREDSRVHECIASEASLNYECITIIFMVFIRWWCEVNQNFPSEIVNVGKMMWKTLMCIANASSQISYPFTIFPFSCMQKGKTKSLDLYFENKICGKYVW